MLLLSGHAPAGSRATSCGGVQQANQPFLPDSQAPLATGDSLLLSQVPPPTGRLLLGQAVDMQQLQQQPQQPQRTSSTSRLQRMVPALGDKWDQFKRHIGKPPAPQWRRSRSTSRPPAQMRRKSRQPEVLPALPPEGALLPIPQEHPPNAAADLVMPDGACTDRPLGSRIELWPQCFCGAEGGSTWDVEALARNVPDEVARQIGLDVPRTQPDRLGPADCEALRRILLAYAATDPVVGYCQGLNNVAAVFVMLRFDEVTALRGLCTLYRAVLVTMRPDSEVT